MQLIYNNNFVSLIVKDLAIDNTEIGLLALKKKRFTFRESGKFISLYNRYWKHK